MVQRLSGTTAGKGERVRGRRGEGEKR